MTGASLGSPMNPKEIEDLMYIVNQTRIEFTVPHEDDNGQGGKKGANQETMNHLLSNHAASEMSVPVGARRARAGRSSQQMAKAPTRLPLNSRRMGRPGSGR
jgi:hypothetical protein